MQTGGESKGKLYKYCDESYPLHPDPRLTYVRDRDVRVKWLNVADGYVMFDLGAEYGIWTLSALSQGAQMVYAAETDPIYVSVIRANLAANNGYRDKSSVIKKMIKLDEFVNELSTPPAQINYIRLGYEYTFKAKAFFNSARKTIKQYKPRLIACLDQTEPAVFLDMIDHSFDSVSLKCNNENYLLIKFR